MRVDTLLAGSATCALAASASSLNPIRVPSLEPSRHHGAGVEKPDQRTKVAGDAGYAAHAEKSFWGVRVDSLLAGSATCALAASASSPTSSRVPSLESSRHHEAGVEKPDQRNPCVPRVPRALRAFPQMQEDPETIHGHNSTELGPEGVPVGARWTGYLANREESSSRAPD